MPIFFENAISRIKEILQRIEQKHDPDNELTKSTESTELWPRFKKVKQAVMSALISQTPGAERSLSTFSWSGEDSGIHDHRGNVYGVVNGVMLDVRLKGTTVDMQPHIITDETDQWRIEYRQERGFEIDGTFTSKDGKHGALSMQVGSLDTPFEAYWLEIGDGTLRLEQVATKDFVYDANTLEIKRGTITIPGTRIELPHIVGQRTDRYY